jgi:hypothetical protein
MAAHSSDVRFAVKSGHWLACRNVRFVPKAVVEQVHQIAPIQSTSSLHQFSEDYDCER